MFRLSISVVTVFIFCISISFAQNPQWSQEINVIPPSPNVTSFQKYIDSPISLYTGTPDVSIPIYTVNTPQLTLPISLTYNASGLKVEERASWVGAGFSLNAGGAVSRSTKGLPDELNEVIRRGFFHNASYVLGNGNFDITKIIDCSTNGVPLTTSYGPSTNPDSIAQGAIDLEPDVFHFSAPGGSGKFVFNVNRVPRKTIADDMVIVSHPFENSAQPQGAYTWVIKDAVGIHYTYKHAEYTSSSSGCGSMISAYNPSIENFQSSWYLDHMALNGDTIKFFYENEQLDYDDQYSESRSEKVGGDGSTSVSSCVIQTEVFAKRLSRIETSTGFTVYFDATVNRLDLTGAKRLEKIRVVKDGNPVLIYKFDYSYFGSNTKLKLDEIKQLSNDQLSELNGYRFEYYTLSSFPPLNSKKQDYWGYYNGANNISLIPPYKTYYWHVNRSSTTNRDPSEYYAKEGALKKLIYPTGGYTEFQYELHDYYSINHPATKIYEASATGGTQGNPVVDITNFSVATNCFVTIFNDEASNDFYSFKEFKKWNGYSYVTFSPTTTAGNRLNLPAGNYQLVAQNGNGGTTFIKVEFEQNENVNVKAGGLRIKNLIHVDDISGKKIVKSYAYTLGQTSNSSGVLFNPIIIGGNVTTNISGQLAGEVSQICTPDPPGYFMSLSVFTQAPMTLYHGSHIGYSEVKEYVIEESDLGTTVSDSDKKIGSTIYKFINDNDPFIYSYPYKPQNDLGYKNGKPIATEVYELNGTQLTKINETRNYYNQITLPGETKAFILKNIISRYCFSCDQSDFEFNEYSYKTVWHYLDKTIESNFDDQQSLALTTKLYNYYDTLSPYAHFLTIGSRTINSSNQDIITEIMRQPTNPELITEFKEFTGSLQTKGEKLTYHGKLLSDYFFLDLSTSTYMLKYHYDYQGNRLSKLTVFPETGSAFTKSYLWGHNNAFPVAEVINASPDEIFYTGFEESGTIATVSNPSKIGLRYLDSETFTFSENGFTPVATDNLKMSYWYWTGSQWDFSGEVSYNNQINSPGSRLDEIRVYPSGGQMNTYTYKSGLGVNSVTDVNNTSTYYEYDLFGRLKCIKDDKGNQVTDYLYHYKQN
jgi:YD repeat-containing protein